jgi:hypothetical protein
LAPAIDGSGREQLTFDDRVTWFPHLSPDGSQFVHSSYDPGTISHPAEVLVELRLLPADDGTDKTVATLVGEQGFFNTNSWSRDCKQFAFTAYLAASPSLMVSDVSHRLADEPISLFDERTLAELWRLRAQTT